MSSEDKDDIDIEGMDDTPSESWGDYPLDTVFVRKDQRTVGDIVSRIEKGRYQLDPDFQRDFVWNPLQQSRLIESSLMRIPLPVLYVAEDTDGKIIVVDGLQRLTTFHHYLKDKFSLKGVGNNDSKSMISGKRFSELPIHLQERIEDTQLTLYILDPKAPERARLDIFERVNSGVPLTRQQMRNCLYSGQATRWLKEASENEHFLRATSHSLKEKTMRNREVINRFCAFYLLGYKEYRGDMEDFLARALVQMNKMTENELHDMSIAFVESMQINFEFFGKHSFRKSMFSPYSPKTVINISLFDTISTVVAKYFDQITDENKDLVKNCLTKLSDNYGFDRAISHATSNSQAVHRRHSFVLRQLAGVGVC